MVFAAATSILLTYTPIDPNTIFDSRKGDQDEDWSKRPSGQQSYDLRYFLKRKKAIWGGSEDEQQFIYRLVEEFLQT